MMQGGIKVPVCLGERCYWSKGDWRMVECKGVEMKLGVKDIVSLTSGKLEGLRSIIGYYCF